MDIKNFGSVVEEESTSAAKSVSNCGCPHYHSPKDIVAIRFKCCDRYYPCYFCHQENEDHPAAPWEASEKDTKAILCRKCQTELSIAEYLSCQNTCPHCQSPFNPGCALHYNLYFNF